LLIPRPCQQCFQSSAAMKGSIHFCRAFVLWSTRVASLCQLLRWPCFLP
jgi:hypothetical protein